LYDLHVAAVDVYGVVQFSPAQGEHADRSDRGRLPQRPETDAAARGHLWRAAAEARPRPDEVPPHRQRLQGSGFHREQRSKAGFHRRRR